MASKLSQTVNGVGLGEVVPCDTTGNNAGQGIESSKITKNGLPIFSYDEALQQATTNKGNLVLHVSYIPTDGIRGGLDGSEHEYFTETNMNIAIVADGIIKTDVLSHEEFPLSNEFVSWSKHGSNSVTRHDSPLKLRSIDPLATADSQDTEPRLFVIFGEEQIKNWINRDSQDSEVKIAYEMMKKELLPESKEMKQLRLAIAALRQVSVGMESDDN